MNVEALCSCLLLLARYTRQSTSCTLDDTRGSVVRVPPAGAGRRRRAATTLRARRCHALHAALLCCCALSLPGCARSTLAVLIPQLELQLALQRSRADVAESPRDEQLHATISAQLRWQSRIEASELPLAYELDPSTWLAPCADDDLECMREAAESEAELGAVFRDEP